VVSFQSSAVALDLTILSPVGAAGAALALTIFSTILRV
jgi:hypothetical protein